MSHAEPRYLEAKRTVDDRSLSRRVRDRLLESLVAQPRVLEAGCGTGTMVPRLYEWGLESGIYVGVDQSETAVSVARELRPAEFRYEGADPVASQGETDFLVGDLSVRFQIGDALSAFADSPGADLLVASAFADLVPISAVLDLVESAVRPGGLAYLPISFDGGTIFQPDHPADEAVEQAYHTAIDAEPGRDSQAGRHLAEALRSAPGDLLGMGSSDWIVRPRTGGYPADERFFLGRILDFVEAAILDTESPREPVADAADWVGTRRDQLAAGELTYVAHQYDFLYRRPEG